MFFHNSMKRSFVCILLCRSSSFIVTLLQRTYIYTRTTESATKRQESRVKSSRPATIEAPCRTVTMLSMPKAEVDAHLKEAELVYCCTRSLRDGLRSGLIGSLQKHGYREKTVASWSRRSTLLLRSSST